MNDFHYRQGELYCEDVPLSRIAKEVGTPCYVYSHHTLVRHFRVYDGAFGNIPHIVAFAMKAKKYGDAQVKIWRRSYDVPPPGGESLKDTAERVLPYYDNRIKPFVLKGETILIAAHGNSLRALVMQLEQLTREQVLELNIPTGAPLLYELDNNGKVLSHRYL